MSLVFLWVFFATMAIGVPIVFALAFGPVVGFLVDGRSAFLTVVAQRLFVGINVYPLLAIPLFILAGEIMNVGGITQRLVDFSQKLVGHLRGGLGHVTIVSATIFSGISGSAVADASALGRILIPSMVKEGYPRGYAAAVTAAAVGARADHPAQHHHGDLRLHHADQRRGPVRGGLHTRPDHRCRADAGQPSGRHQAPLSRRRSPRHVPRGGPLLHRRVLGAGCAVPHSRRHTRRRVHAHRGGRGRGALRHYRLGRW